MAPARAHSMRAGEGATPRPTGYSRTEREDKKSASRSRFTHTTHVKIAIGMGDDEVKWLYAGSHNVSSAAWGSWCCFDGPPAPLNFECGVLLRGASAQRAATEALPWDLQKAERAMGDGEAPCHPEYLAVERGRPPGAQGSQ